MPVNIAMDVKPAISVQIVMFALLAAGILLASETDGTCGSRRELALIRGRVETVTASGALISTSQGNRWISSESLWNRCYRSDSLLALGTLSGMFLNPLSMRVRPWDSPVRKIREGFARSLEERVNDPCARGLAGALLMGLRGRIPEQTATAFRNSGTSHLLALSGMHTALAASLMALLSSLLFGRRPLSAFLSIAGIALFVIVSGARPSTFRAGIMASCAVLWLCFHGGGTRLLSFWWAAVIISLLLMPETLTDRGAWMSYGAVLSLILLGRSFGGKAGFLLSPLFAGVTVTVSLAPLVSSMYGGIMWLGPVATVVSLPMMITVMITGIPAALGIPPGALLLGWISELWLHTLELFSHDPLVIPDRVLLPLWILAVSGLRVISCWRGFHRRFR